MGFETFEPLPTEAPRRVATIRFLNKGRVSFNAAAARLLSNYTHLRLLFDADTDAIGLEPTSSDDALGYKLTFADSQAVLTAPGFAERYDLRGGQRYAITRNVGSDEDDNVPYIAKIIHKPETEGADE